MPAKLLYKLLRKKVRDMDMNLVLWIWSTRTQTKVLVLVLTHFFSTRTRTHAKQSTRTRDLCTRPNPASLGLNELKVFLGNSTCLMPIIFIRNPPKQRQTIIQWNIAFFLMKPNKSNTMGISLGTTILVPGHLVKSMQIILRPVTRR